MIVSKPADGPHQRDRVEPVVHASAPQDHTVIAADARHRAADRGLVGGWWDARDAERSDVYQAAHGGVGVIGGAVDPSRSGEMPEPEVTLLLAAQMKKSPRRSCACNRRWRRRSRPAAPRTPCLVTLLELLQVDWVVEVDDEHRVGSQRIGVRENPSLKDDDVRAVDLRAELVTVGTRDVEDRVLELARSRREKPHVVVDRQPRATCSALIAGPAIRGPSTSPVATSTRLVVAEV